MELLVRLAAVWTFVRFSSGSMGALSSGPPSGTVALAATDSVLSHEGEELVSVHVVETFLLVFGLPRKIARVLLNLV